MGILVCEMRGRMGPAVSSHLGMTAPPTGSAHHPCPTHELMDEIQAWQHVIAATLQAWQHTNPALHQHKDTLVSRITELELGDCNGKGTSQQAHTQGEA